MIEFIHLVYIKEDTKFGSTPMDVPLTGEKTIFQHITRGKLRVIIDMESVKTTSI